MNNLSWKCHVCGEDRPDAQISVFKRDVGVDGGMPAGTMMNVRYCNDNPKCVEGAKTFSFTEKKK